jgi:hypothetical protein
MALTTYSDIKQQLIDEWEYYITEENTHLYAEELIPVYYSEIIEEWNQLPNEYTDVWHDYVGELNSNTRITTLMSYDLFQYYFDLVDKAFNEIKEADNA